MIPLPRLSRPPVRQRIWVRPAASFPIQRADFSSLTVSISSPRHIFSTVRLICGENSPDLSDSRHTPPDISVVRRSSFEKRPNPDARDASPLT